ncbi:MAG: hypothetical protein K6T92_10000, partial [Candidatus Rokubacteria bacterium]|nr:hypothetical protein [Candidatus Rokubacteria bacterium]
MLIGLLVGLAAAGAAGAAGAEPRERAARQTLFIGLDTSGSFQRAGYDDALSFLALYIHGHLEGLGGLQRPRDLFVAAVGGRQTDEPK